MVQVLTEQASRHFHGLNMGNACRTSTLGNLLPAGFSLVQDHEFRMKGVPSGSALHYSLHVIRVMPYAEFEMKHKEFKWLACRSQCARALKAESKEVNTKVRSLSPLK